MYMYMTTDIQNCKVFCHILVAYVKFDRKLGGGSGNFFESWRAMALWPPLFMRLITYFITLIAYLT